MVKYFADDNLTFQDGASATISVKSWFLLHLLGLFNLIPLVGFIVWLVIYLLIGFSSETAPSIRNYIKLQFIFCLIGIVLAIILVIVGILLYPSLLAATGGVQ